MNINTEGNDRCTVRMEIAKNADRGLGCSEPSEAGGDAPDPHTKRLGGF